MTDKLTKTQAEILTNVENGWRLLKTVGGYIFADGRFTRRATTVSVEKLIGIGAVEIGQRLDTGNYPLALTDAGRAVLSRHRGEQP